MAGDEADPETLDIFSMLGSIGFTGLKEFEAALLAQMKVSGIGFESLTWLQLGFGDERMQFHLTAYRGADLDSRGAEPEGPFIVRNLDISVR